MKKLLFLMLVLAMFACTEPDFPPQQNGDDDKTEQPNTPNNPDTPDNPDQPNDPNTPDKPDTPDLPNTPDVPQPEVFKRDTIKDNYVEYRTGNLPIIISAPHGSTTKGGTVDGKSLVKRTESNLKESDCCSFSTSQDAYTMTLAQFIEAAIYEKTGKYPYVVIAKQHRSYIDFNRHKECAIPYVNGAYSIANEISYDTYHEYATAASADVEKKFGQGILLDIHGHGHDVQQVEIGYLLSKTQLTKTDDELNVSDSYAKKSSIYSLSLRNKNNLSFVELLRGEFSFGDYLKNAGLACVPHSGKLNPADKESYFSGGYISQSQGSSYEYGGTVDAIQLEFGNKVRNDESKRAAAGKSVAKAVIEYMKKHYNTTAFD